MSKSKNTRKYALDVAQQFLQKKFKSGHNPLEDEEHFRKVRSYPSDFGSRSSFYNYYHTLIKEFLQEGYGFTHEKLGLLIAAGIAVKDESIKPIRSSLANTYGHQPAWWGGGAGPDMLLSLATISVAAAAYDLCWAKHYEGGVRPL